MQDTDVNERLKNPAGRGARVGFAFLVGTGLLAVPQGLTYPPLDCRIHQQTQGHDAPGRFQEQGRGHEDRGFQETEPAFDFGLPVVILPCL